MNGADGSIGSLRRGDVSGRLLTSSGDETAEHRAVLEFIDALLEDERARVALSPSIPLSQRPPRSDVAPDATSDVPLTLPRVSAASCVYALCKVGFAVKIANENGTALERDGRIVFVPPESTLSATTLRLILYVGKLTLDEFNALVDS